MLTAAQYFTAGKPVKRLLRTVIIAAKALAAIAAALLVTAGPMFLRPVPPQLSVLPGPLPRGRAE